jgi:excisionase family DNA binding protein
LSAGLFVLQNSSPLHNTAKNRVNLTGGKPMKESVYTAYEDLPLFLNAETVAKLLGISISSSYELMHEKGFPSLRIGSRLIVPKEKFRAWVEEKTGGNI